MDIYSVPGDNNRFLINLFVIYSCMYLIVIIMKYALPITGRMRIVYFTPSYEDIGSKRVKHYNFFVARFSTRRTNVHEPYRVLERVHMSIVSKIH